MTVAEGAQAYLAHLEEQGRSPSTCGTAKRALALLVAHLGSAREVGDIAAKDIDGFFASEAATKQQGRPRAAASVAQLRGIVRTAFAWWQQAGPAFPPSWASQPLTPAPAPPTSTPVRSVAEPRALTVAPTRATYLDLTYEGQPVRFAKTEIDRARLYGLRKLVALDAEGRECQSALLTRDGRYVLPTGCTADLYIDECGDTVARRELVAVHEASASLSAGPPTVNCSLEIAGPIAACELLDYAVTRVYALHRVAVPAKLARALGVGALFLVPYRSRPGATETPAFLLGSEAGAFLILAEPHCFDFVGPDQPALPAEDPDEDDIDAFAFPGDFGGPHDPA